ncbi:MAG: ABC transporter ATP-binding protein [Clostridium sp.]|nr:ABC transporter ATP-binding protein [Clostridium sp.]
MKVELKNIGKQYTKDFWGVKNINLELDEGVIGLLGSNGAGKSTLMRILTMVTKPTCGEILVNGKNVLKNPESLRSVLGYLPQNFGVYPNLNALEFLEYIASVKGIRNKDAKRRIDELLQLLNLHDVCKRPIGEYSGGMKQRVGIAQALLNDPKLLVVDEPTVGLDPEERVRIRNLFSEIASDRIILYSTHIVSDIEAISNKIAIINKGRLNIYNTNEKIIDMVSDKVWEATVNEDELKKLKDKLLVSNVVRYGNESTLRIVSETVPTINAKRVKPTLEDAYLYFSSHIRKENE